MEDHMGAGTNASNVTNMKGTHHENHRLYLKMIWHTQERSFILFTQQGIDHHLVD